MPSTYSSPAHSTDRPWSLSCFLCLFKEWKNVCCHLQRAHHCSSSRPWLSECHNDTHSYTLSEVEKKKEKEKTGGGGKTRKQNWHIQLLIWNKIIQEVPVLMHLTCGREHTVHLKKKKKAFKFCKPCREKKYGYVVDLKPDLSKCMRWFVFDFFEHLK